MVQTVYLELLLGLGRSWDLVHAEMGDFGDAGRHSSHDCVIDASLGVVFLDDDYSATYFFDVFLESFCVYWFEGEDIDDSNMNT